MHQYMTAIIRDPSVYVSGCWLLHAGCWLLQLFCWLLAAGCCLLAACLFLLAAVCWLQAARCWLLGFGCWLLAAILLFFTRNSLFSRTHPAPEGAVQKRAADVSALPFAGLEGRGRRILLLPVLHKRPLVRALSCMFQVL